MKTDPHSPSTGMQTSKQHQGYLGLTKREYFAGVAMRAMDAKNDEDYSAADLQKGRHIAHAKYLAKTAVRMADALIEELNAE